MRTVLSIDLGAVAASVLVRRIFQRVACAAFGHRVNNRIFASERGAHRQCPCGAVFLKEDGSETRVSHTLSCFLFGHSYTRMGARDGHCEYVCVTCGHPLLFESEHSSYARKDAFHKQVRYLCGVFGHRVHTVAKRHGMTEYACHCGHSFLCKAQGREKVRHPLVCVFAGHYIRFVECRNGYAEHRCRNCGHTFCFVANT